MYFSENFFPISNSLMINIFCRYVKSVDSWFGFSKIEHTSSGFQGIIPHLRKPFWNISGANVFFNTLSYNGQKFVLRKTGESIFSIFQECTDSLHAPENCNFH
ncbi:hypothetical protein HHI36_000710 [Cryptolaemus montrouzieri]|uniref:Uncharacterized protein n=1 Tax=Cryptolaemus montrouzieri TaxID=559131 RepID=A0ABD2P5J8_9CUCU